MTMYHVIKPDGTFVSEDYVGALEYGTPAFATLRQLIGIKENETLEHVTVLWKGKRAHMFVDEDGRMHKKPRNEKATRIYYNFTFQRFRYSQYNDLTQHPNPADRFFEEPGFDIVGTAILWEGDME
jgi:hypothetical protein